MRTATGGGLRRFGGRTPACRPYGGSPCLCPSHAAMTGRGRRGLATRGGCVMGRTRGTAASCVCRDKGRDGVI